MKTMVLAAAMVALGAAGAFAQEVSSAADFFQDFGKKNPGLECTWGGSSGS